MTCLSFSKVQSEPVALLNVDLETGVHWLLGDEPTCAARLIELAAGVLSPRRGRVTLDNTSLHGSRALRTQIGALPAQVNLPRVTVESLLSSVLSAKESDLTAAAVLTRWDLSGWGTLPCANLSQRDARALALLLALCTRKPKLLALYDPFALGLPHERIQQELETAAATGAVVLIAAPGTLPGSSAVLGASSQWIFQHGHLLAAASVPSLAGTPVHTTLRITCTPVRILAERLSTDARVTSLNVDANSAPNVLQVTGADAKGLAHAVTEAALQVNVEITQLSLGSSQVSPPPVSEDA